MELEQITMIGILVIVAILTTIITVKRHKANGDSNNINIVLLEHMAELMEIAKSALFVLETQRDNFPSDRKYYEALSAVIMRDVRDFLVEKADLDPKLLDLATEKNLSEIVYVIVYQLKKHKSEEPTVEDINTEENLEELYVEGEDKVTESSTVDITSELNKILENSDSVSPWDDLNN